MTQPDALVAVCRSLARMEEGPTKRGLQQTAFEMLEEYEVQGHITADMRLMLEHIVMETPPSPLASDAHVIDADHH